MSLLLLGFALAAGPDPAVVVGPPTGDALSGESLEDAVDRVSATIRCPVCQGMSVADSPSESGRAMKEEVRQLVAQGYDDEQVVAYFEASYGEFIRLDPRAEGWNLTVWVLPLLVLVGGLGASARLAYRWSSRPALPATVVPQELMPYLEQVWAEVGTAEAPRG